MSLDDLDDAQRKDLQRRLELADLAALAERSPIPGAGADIYQYDITVHYGARRSEIVVAQTAVPDTLRPLIDWLEQRSTRSRTK